MAREVFVLEEKEGDEFVPRETSDRDGAARLQESANASAMIGVDCRVVRYVPEDELERLRFQVRVLTGLIESMREQAEQDDLDAAGNAWDRDTRD